MIKYKEFDYEYLADNVFNLEKGWYKESGSNPFIKKLYSFGNKMSVTMWSKEHTEFEYYTDVETEGYITREEFKKELAIRRTPLYKAVYGE